jgi:hypothetical protein
MILISCADIEDMLTTLSFLYGKKWTSMMVKRTYFGNWLRDYSQAVDIGSLKTVNAETIRILVFIGLLSQLRKLLLTSGRSGFSLFCPSVTRPKSSR